MKQFYAQPANLGDPGTGPFKIRAANKIHWASPAAKKREELKVRNAYRAAIGLPVLK